MRKHYVIFPGPIRSAKDHQIHHPSGVDLARLYGLEPGRYMIADTEVRLKYAQRQYPESPILGPKFLHYRCVDCNGPLHAKHQCELDGRTNDADAD
jgi:hypothetical protein